MSSIREIALAKAVGGGGGGKTSLKDATVTAGANKTYNGQQQTQSVTVVSNTVTLTETQDYTVSGNTGTNAGTYDLTVTGVNNFGGSKSVEWSIAKAQSSVSVSPSTLIIPRDQGSTGTAELTVTGGGAVSASSSDSSVATASVSGNTLTVTAVADGQATITVNVAGTDNWLASSATLAVIVQEAKVYGVEWNYSNSSTVLTRTDDAASFAEPVPAVNGGDGSSPFDACMPWSGMVRETVDGNAMVKIPKFWYKWTDEANVLKLQIADSPVEGFHVSPAHADRSDGKGERDYVYIGRYHCNDSYRSVTYASPIGYITRATARTGCKNVGTGYSQLDYAMLWTVRMLYLVEFANWNSQTMIGYGCGNGSSAQNTGASDNMTYHTGTMQANRTTYGVGVQYRHIEDLWGGVCDWCDGIVLSSRSAYITNVIADYSDSTTKHTKVSDGPSGNGVISSWDVPTISGLEWALYPNAIVSISDTDTYVTDTIDPGKNVVYVGGGYFQNQFCGMFMYTGVLATDKTWVVGARLQKLP